MNHLQTLLPISLLQTSNGKGTLSEEITRRCPSESARVLVIGGGISAAQAAVAAARAGHQVVLRSGRPLQTRPFDIDHGWLDMRKADRQAPKDARAVVGVVDLSTATNVCPSGFQPSGYTYGAFGSHPGVAPVITYLRGIL